jgi:outer membrane protein assembly factor BamB
MKIKKTLWTGIAAGLFATAHAEFETAFFRGNAGHTGSFPAQSGKGKKGLKWKFQTGDAVVSSPVLSGGQVFVGSLDGSVYALDAATGDEVWKVDTGAPVSGSAAVADGTVYIASENGHLYALDAATGKIQWNQTMTGKHPAGSPLVYGDRVYISMGGPGSYNTMASYTDKAAGFSRADGAKVWESSGTAAQGFESPVIYSNTLISCSGRESYAAYSLSSGKAVWTQSRDKSYGSQFACAALADNRLFVVGSIAGSLHAIHPATGARLWTAFVDPQQGNIMGGGDPGNAVLTSPAVSGNRIFIGSDTGVLFCYDTSTGSLLWSNSVGSAIQSSPAVADGVVYFGCHDGKLYAVDETDGDALWNYSTGARIISSPWVTDDSVYFGCDDGAVYCLE